LIIRVAWSKSSLLLKNILHNTQSLQLFKTVILNVKIFTMVIKMAKQEGLSDGWSIRREGRAQVHKVIA
jgi:hypothetical protein